MIEPDLQIKIDHLTAAIENGAFPEDTKKIQGWTEQLKLASLQHNLYKHPAMQPVWKSMQDEIDGINQHLIEKIDLPNREVLIKYRNLVRAILSRFADALTRKEDIKSQIEVEAEYVATHQP